MKVICVVLGFLKREVPKLVGKIANLGHATTMYQFFSSHERSNLAFSLYACILNDFLTSLIAGKKSCLTCNVSSESYIDSVKLKYAIARIGLYIYSFLQKFCLYMYMYMQQENITNVYCLKLIQKFS